MLEQSTGKLNTLYHGLGWIWGGVLLTIYFLTWMGTQDVFSTQNYTDFSVYATTELVSIKGNTRHKHKGKKLKVKVLFLKQLINKMNSSVKSQNT